MVKVGVISSKEAFDREKNPILCLSPSRVFKSCNECDKFIKALNKAGRGNATDPVKSVIATMICKPQISDEKINLLIEIEQNKKRLKDLKSKLQD